MIGTYADSVRRVLIGRVVATCGAAGTVAATFLPWVQSGRRQRSSYQIFPLIERLGFSPSGVIGWALRLWPLLPLIIVATITLLWFDRPRTALAVGSIAVVYAGAVSIAVRSASPSALTTLRYGPIATIVGAAVFAAGLVTCAKRDVPAARRGALPGDPS